MIQGRQNLAVEARAFNGNRRYGRHHPRPGRNLHGAAGYPGHQTLVVYHCDRLVAAFPHHDGTFYPIPVPVQHRSVQLHRHADRGQCRYVRFDHDTARRLHDCNVYTPGYIVRGGRDARDAVVHRRHQPVTIHGRHGLIATLPGHAGLFDGAPVQIEHPRGELHRLADSREDGSVGIDLDGDRRLHDRDGDALCRVARPGRYGGHAVVHRGNQADGIHRRHILIAALPGHAGPGNGLSVEIQYRGGELHRLSDGHQRGFRRFDDDPAGDLHHPDFDTLR